VAVAAGSLAAVLTTMWPGVAAADAIPNGTLFTLGLQFGDMPQKIVAGPDGNVWFTTTGQHSTPWIAKVTPAGAFTTFTQGFTGPDDLTTGHDGNIWYVSIEGVIGRMTPAGAATEFRMNADNLPGPLITAGPDGNLWFPLQTGFGRITTGGSITMFSGGPGCALTDITPGPDNALWTTETNCEPFITGGAIGREGLDGSFTNFTAGITGNPLSIVAGPDGNLWFTERSGQIGRITPSGRVTEFRFPGITSPRAIARGPAPDDHLWVTDTNALVSLSTTGRVTRYPTGPYQPINLVPGPNHAMWFTVDGTVAGIGELGVRLCHVPNLVGSTLAAAEQLLRDGHCSLGHVRGPHGRPGRLIVTAQGSAAGRVLAEGAAISVSVRKRPKRH
jgi:streptogramin lyase